MVQQAPGPEAEQSHGPGPLLPSPGHSDHAGVEVETVDLAARLHTGVEHQLRSGSAESENRLVSGSGSGPHTLTLSRR